MNVFFVMFSSWQQLSNRYEFFLNMTKFVDLSVISDVVLRDMLCICAGSPAKVAALFLPSHDNLASIRWHISAWLGI